jgi:hypothetical protein
VFIIAASTGAICVTMIGCMALVVIVALLEPHKPIDWDNLDVGPGPTD